MDDGCHCDGHDGSAGSSIESDSSSSHGQHFECVDKSSGLTTVFERGFETGPDGELRPILPKKVFAADRSQ
jgi:hypothetical protein